MTKINMGVIQGRASTLNKEQLIDYAKTLTLTDSQKLRLWNHWQTVQAIRDRQINE